jgi:hypothetical protein
MLVAVSEWLATHASTMHLAELIRWTALIQGITSF